MLYKKNRFVSKVEDKKQPKVYKDEECLKEYHGTPDSIYTVTVTQNIILVSFDKSSIFQTKSGTLRPVPRKIFIVPPCSWTS
jgi:hypothetical protein